MVLVTVSSGHSEHAIKTLKRKMQRELVFRSLKKKRAYESRSEAKVRKQQEAERRKHKVARKSFMEG